MANSALWLTPLILLPGVALLIMSTVTRYGQLHIEFKETAGDEEELMVARQLLFRRSSLFRNTLISLYVSVGLFACAGLLGGLVKLWLDEYTWVAMGLTCLGIASLVYASIQLIREAFLSMERMEGQCRSAGEMEV